MGLSFPSLVPCLSQGGLSTPESSSVQFSMKKLGQMSPAASYLHQAALRTHPGHHPVPPGRWPAPSLAPPTCSQTTTLRRKQQAAQARAPTSQKLLPSLQTMSLGGLCLLLAPYTGGWGDPKARAKRCLKGSTDSSTAESQLNATYVYSSSLTKHGRDPENCMAPAIAFAFYFFSLCGSFSLSLGQQAQAN